MIIVATQILCTFRPSFKINSRIIEKKENIIPSVPCIDYAILLKISNIFVGTIRLKLKLKLKT